MVQFRTFADTFLFKEASTDSEKLAPIPINTAYAGEPADGFVKTLIPTVFQHEGFVKITAVSKQIKIPEPLVAEDFVNFCGLVTYAAREVGADRDYLMAVAYECTNKLDPAILGAKASPKAGPFQFTAETWQAAINGVAANAGFTVEQRLDWLRQPKMAALLAKDATEKFQKEFKRLPVFKELYFLQLVGDAALAALKTPTDPCSESIIKILAEGRDAAEFKAGITVNAALTALQKRLEAAYVEALKVIDKLKPEDRFTLASVGDPPWMAVAREQLASGIKEDPGERNTPEIAAYFQAINAHVGTIAGQTVPWCGAFVGYCLKTCGVPAAAAKVAPEAVGVDYWLSWDPVPTTNPPPVGSIVVFRGEHVGFLAEGSTDTVLKILGGNQSNRVSIMSRARAGAEFRWFSGVSLFSAPAAPAGGGAPGQLGAEGLKLIKHYEGCEKRQANGTIAAYQDLVGVWTIGYGHTAGVAQGQVISQDQAENLLVADVRSREKTVRNLVRVALTPGQFDALVSFEFNLGRLGTSTLLSLLNKGNYAGAANEFPKWNKATQNGQLVEIEGLTRRRLSEQHLFNTGQFKIF
jgi:lysozyme